MKNFKESITKKRLLIAGGIVLLIIAVVTSFGFWLYSSPTNSVKINTLKKLNLPVARVNSSLIGARELFDRYAIATQLYGTDSNFQPSQAQTDILDRLIEVKKLENISGSRNISLTNQEVNTEYDRISTQEGGADKMTKMLNDSYHFTPDQFKEKALRPDMIKTKLAISYYEDKTLNPTLYQTLGTVQNKLSQNSDFGELAKTYSEDPATKQFGGDSGVIPITDLAPEFLLGLKDKQNGQVITITTRFGIYIIKIVNRKDDGAGDGSIHFQAIYLNYGQIDPKVTESAFTKWYNDQASTITVKKYINL